MEEEAELKAVITTTPFSTAAITSAGDNVLSANSSGDDVPENDDSKISSPLPAPTLANHHPHPYHQHTLRHHASTRSNSEEHASTSSHHHHHHHQQGDDEGESPTHTTHSVHPQSSSTIRHSHKSRRSAEVGDQISETTPPTTSPPSQTRSRSTESVTMTPEEGSSSPYPEMGSSLPPEFFKQGDERHFFDQQHYYQQSFQHQFQFSYSPPSNCEFLLKNY